MRSEFPRLIPRQDDFALYAYTQFTCAPVCVDAVPILNG